MKHHRRILIPIALAGMLSLVLLAWADHKPPREKPMDKPINTPRYQPPPPAPDRPSDGKVKATIKGLDRLGYRLTFPYGPEYPEFFAFTNSTARPVYGYYVRVSTVDHAGRKDDRVFIMGTGRMMAEPPGAKRKALLETLPVALNPHMTMIGALGQEEALVGEGESPPDRRTLLRDPSSYIRSDLYQSAEITLLSVITDEAQFVGPGAREFERLLRQSYEEILKTDETKIHTFKN